MAGASGDECSSYLQQWAVAIKAAGLCGGALASAAASRLLSQPQLSPAICHSLRCCPVGVVADVHTDRKQRSHLRAISAPASDPHQVLGSTQMGAQGVRGSFSPESGAQHLPRLAQVLGSTECNRQMRGSCRNGHNSILAAANWGIAQVLSSYRLHQRQQLA